MSRHEKPQWKQLISQSVIRPDSLPASFGIDGTGLSEVTARYPMLVNPYYLGLIRQKGDAIYRQCIPDMREITNQAAWKTR
jgi:lysine 2,3-aminomutase